MAEQTTKKKPGRPKKVVETPVVETNNNDELIKALMEQIKQQNEKMAELQAQIDNNKTYAPAPQNDYSIKKIKLINLMHNPLNVSTEPLGQGRVYAFEDYGDTRFVKFDDLMDIVASQPHIMEKGLCYIADKKAVEMLGLEEEYKDIITPEIMNLMPALKEEYLVDLFVNMDSNLQNSMAIEMAKRINANKRMDYNYLQRIKDEAGIDIQEIARDLKDLERKPNEEE